MIVLLDSGPLGLVTNPRGKTEALECERWSKALALAGHLVLVPEIIDYEHRRELLLNDALAAVARLDGFKENGAYLPVTEAAFLQGARFWAEVRRRGQPTADRHALDVDVLLAAQAATFDRLDWDRSAEEEVVIATTNVGHLSRFADARLWADVPTDPAQE